MVGLGETKKEVLEVMDQLRSVDCDILTIGQYLQPTKSQLPVQRFVRPDEFELLRKEGIRRGFRHVESAPFVRSSYHAWKHTPEEVTFRNEELDSRHSLQHEKVNVQPV